MIWASFAATGPGHFAAIESTINPALNQNILKINVRPIKTMVNEAHINYTPKWLTKELRRKVQASTQLKCCGVTIREMHISKCPKTSMN